MENAHFRDEFPESLYYQTKALGHSGAHDLLTRCPEFMRYNNVAFNPAAPERSRRDQEFGTAAHLMLFRPTQWQDRIVVIDAPNYMKKDAQGLRDAARLNGQTPILADEQGELVNMMHAIADHPIAGPLIRDGISERSYFWTDPATSVPLKARPDFICAGGDRIVDYKTTTNAHPSAFQRRMWDMGHYLQDPWYCEGLHAVSGVTVREFWYIVQEVDPPYLVTVMRLSESARLRAYERMGEAIKMFAATFAMPPNRWSGYSTLREGFGPFTVDLPRFAEYALTEQDVEREMMERDR